MFLGLDCVVTQFALDGRPSKDTGIIAVVQAVIGIPTETQAARKTRFRRKAIQQQSIKAKTPKKVQNPVPKEKTPLPDRKQVLRKRVILVKSVRKKLAETEARRAATHSMPTPKLPRNSSKPVREQLQRLANYLLGKLKQLLAHAASAVVNALIYLVGA